MDDEIARQIEIDGCRERRFRCSLFACFGIRRRNFTVLHYQSWSVQNIEFSREADYQNHEWISFASRCFP